MLPALMLVATTVAAAPAAATTTTFDTAGEHEYTVPGGVTEIAVTAIGGRGASTDGAGFQGNGARIRSRVTVTPGQTLYAIVGGNASGRTPGYNGGGAVGAADVCPRGPGAGGGASDIRTKSLSDPETAASRILVAGGGGGTGGPGTHIFVIPPDDDDPELREFDAWGGTGGDRGNIGRFGSGDTGFDGTPDPQPGIGGRGARGTGDPAGAGSRTGTTTDGGTGGIASDTDYGCGGGGGGGYGGGAGGGAAQEKGGGGGGGGGGSLDPAGNWFGRPALPSEQPSIVIDDDPPALDGVLDLTPDVYVSTKNMFTNCSATCNWCTLPENGHPDGGCQQLAADAGNYDAGYRSQQAWGNAVLVRARRGQAVMGIHPGPRRDAGLGEAFVLGNLAHFNEPTRDISPTTSIGLGGFVTLRLPAGDPISIPIGKNTWPNSNFPAVQLEFLETDNDPPCDPSIQVSNTPCDDHWRISDDPATPVTVKGVTFQFTHLGFKKPDDTFVKTISTEERQITAADFYGKITASSNATTTALVAGAGPKFTATVSPAPWTGDGAVAFKDGGSTIEGCSAVPVDPETGVATCTPASIGSSYSVTAKFSGGVGFGASESDPVVSAPPHVPVTLTVDDDKAQCPAAGFTKIQDAVNAAGTGDTINVCRGTYNENVTLGAGKDNVSLMSSTAAAAAVVKGSAPFVVEGAQGVSIQKFRVEPTAGSTGILVSFGSSADLIRTNLVVGGGVGLGVLNGTVGTARDNSFLSQTVNGVAVLASGAPAAADVQANTITGTVSSNGVSYTGLGGAATGHVFGNTINKNGQYGVVLFGSAATGTPVVKANNVFQNGAGIAINGITATVENNTVTSNTTTGLSTSTGGSTFTSNNARNNTGADCSDTSSGSGTAGTANTWTANYGVDPAPAGICKK